MKIPWEVILYEFEASLDPEAVAKKGGQGPIPISTIWPGWILQPAIL